MLRKIVIECPQCGQRLSFNEVRGYQQMAVTCARCGYRDKAGTFRNITPPQAPPLNQGGYHQPSSGGFGGAQGGDGHTVLRPGGAGICSDPGLLRVLATGQSMPLRPGTNTIGRRAQTSTASIQIDTNDMYMSRSHIRIDVIPRGNGFEHNLIEIKATNKVKYNRQPLSPGDIVRLRFGDHITIGHTELVFESQQAGAATVLR